VQRKPQSARTDALTIEIPTLAKPNVTMPSCQLGAPKPAPVMGDGAAVPKIAARVVTVQCAFAPYSALHYVASSRAMTVGHRPRRRLARGGRSIHRALQVRREPHARVPKLLFHEPGKQTE
jgi:hypothetical protein